MQLGNARVAAVFLLGSFLGMSASAQLAPAKDIDHLNSVLAEILQPWNHGDDRARIAFKEIQYRAPVRIQLDALYQLAEPAFALKLRDLRFSDRSVGPAALDARGSIALDWSRVLGRKRDWNDAWMKDVEAAVEARLQDLVDGYGKAAQSSTRVTEIQREDSGQIALFKMQSDLRVDLDRLEDQQQRPRLLFQKARAYVTVDHAGARFQFAAELNPEYVGALTGRVQLRDFLGELLRLETPALQHVVDFVRVWDAWIGAKLRIAAP